MKYFFILSIFNSLIYFTKVNTFKIEYYIIYIWCIVYDVLNFICFNKLNFKYDKNNKDFLNTQHDILYQLKATILDLIFYSFIIFMFNVIPYEYIQELAEYLNFEGLEIFLQSHKQINILALLYLCSKCLISLKIAEAKNEKERKEYEEKEG